MGGGGTLGFAAPGPDSGEIVIRLYRLPEGKREAFFEFMSRSDVPILVSQAPEGINVQATPRQHEIVGAFIQIVNPSDHAAAAADALKLERAAVERARAQGVTTVVPRIAQKAKEYERAAVEAAARARGDAEKAHLDAMRQTIHSQRATLEQHIRQLNERAEELRRKAKELQEQSRDLRSKADGMNDGQEKDELYARADAVESQADSVDSAADQQDEQADTVKEQIDQMIEQLEQAQEESEAAAEAEAAEHEEPVHAEHAR
jgi:methyl-accepting chemotaxis protein